MGTLLYNLLKIKFVIFVDIAKGFDLNDRHMLFTDYKP